MSQNIPSFYSRLGKDKTDAVDGLLGKFNTHVFCLNSCPRTNKWASDLIGRGIHHRANKGGSVGTSRSRGMNEGTSANSGTSSSHGSSYGSGGGCGGNSSSGTSAGTGESYGANIGSGENRNESWGTSEHMDNLIEPGFFASGLKNGGTANNYEVTAVLFRAGANFAQGFVSPSTLLLTFRQNRR